MDTLRIGGRRYSDPDIISLCRQSGELIDPRSTIVNMARSLSEKANGFSGLPDDPLERLKIIASLNRIKMLPMDIDQVRREKRDAVLYPTASGWTIVANLYISRLLVGRSTPFVLTSPSIRVQLSTRRVRV